MAIINERVFSGSMLSKINFQVHNHLNGKLVVYFLLNFLIRLISSRLFMSAYICHILVIVLSLSFCVFKYHLILIISFFVLFVNFLSLSVIDLVFCFMHTLMYGSIIIHCAKISFFLLIVGCSFFQNFFVWSQYDALSHCSSILSGKGVGTKWWHT